MKTILPFFTALLASTYAAQYVVDGSFEAVPDSDEFKKGITSGPWTLKGGATFVDNGLFTDVYRTPYGRKFVSVDGGRRVSRGSVRQRISGLTPGATYTISYAYQPFANDVECTLSAIYGSQTIDSVSIPAQDGIITEYSTRSNTFTPTQASGTLSLNYVCPRARQIIAGLDKIALTGP